MQSLFPFIGTYRARAVASGFREKIPRAEVDLSAFPVMTTTTFAVSTTSSTLGSTTTSSTIVSCTPNWPSCIQQASNLGLVVSLCPDLNSSPDFLGNCLCVPCNTVAPSN